MKGQPVYISAKYINDLPAGLLTVVFSRWNLEVTAQVSLLAAALALVFGCIGHLDVMHATIEGKKQRAYYHPFRSVVDVLPPPATAETVPTAPLPPPDPARSFVYNHAGKRETMTLMQTDKRLIDFLDACIALSAPDKTVFPSYSDLRHYGIPNVETEAMLTWLGDAVIRQERKATRIAHGKTLGDLRRMAAGG